MKSGKLLLYIFFIPFFVFSQPDSFRDYLFPIRPGEQNFLAGTMGEMRSGHFHGGIDIKTGGRIGLPVLATSDGYISRINISADGYGHALYLTHNDKNISVYAHLDRFEESLEEYSIEKQYQNESYELRDFPENYKFYFKQGDTIAYSGNTGSSTGPHLHFEIRDPNQRFLNPLSFGFSEIIDNLPPILNRIAFITLDKNARINDAFGRYEFEIIKVNGKYTTRRPLVLEGNVGIQIYHYDNFNGTYSRNGIPEITLMIDDDTVFQQVKESMSFDLNRNILAHMDFTQYMRSRKRFNKFYIEDGNELDIYRHAESFTFQKDKSNVIKVYLRDSHNNISTFETTINNRKIVYPETPNIYKFDIVENNFHFVSSDSLALLYYNYIYDTIRPYLSHKLKNYFLWDLRNGLPDSIITSFDTYYPGIYASIPSGFDYSFYNTHFDISTGPKTLFDTVYLRFEKSVDDKRNLEIFSFKNSDNPLRLNATVTLKPDRFYSENYNVFSVSGSRLKYVGGKRNDNGTFTFKTRDLASFTIATDSIAPTIIPLTWNPGYLRIKIKDELSGIKSYRATLDNVFLLMKYDSKKDILQAQPRIPNTSIKGEFVLIVEDYFGNKSEIKRIL